MFICQNCKEQTKANEDQHTVVTEYYPADHANAGQIAKEIKICDECFDNMES